MTEPKMILPQPGTSGALYPGIYPVLLSYPDNEGLPPGASYWNGMEWDERWVSYYWPVSFVWRADALEYAREHDPGW